MKSRPILFNAPMVRALLDGSKTQTRRVCKPMNAWVDQDCREVRNLSGVPHHYMKGAKLAIERLRSPYGQVGDQLWVRESFYEEFDRAPIDEEERLDWIESGYLLYRASDDQAYGSGGFLPWKPSIHMPRWSSRITLEIISVRVERLHDITRGDCMAEGCPFPNLAKKTDPKGWYSALWTSINGADSWDANPWVWVIEFKKVTAESATA